MQNPNVYGTVAYMRYKIPEGKFKTVFVWAKSRIAPLKKLMLPCLESISALIDARIADYLRKMLQFSDAFFWN